jgi:hypothetical protein
MKFKVVGKGSSTKPEAFVEKIEKWEVQNPATLNSTTIQCNRACKVREDESTSFFAEYWQTIQEF